MAKATSKAPAKKAEKKPAKKAAAKPKVSLTIDKACEEALEALRALNMDPQLQADLEWCLGSFRADSNPTGLYEMAGRALILFTEEKKKKTKGVTAKLVGNLEKVLASA